MTTRKAVRRIMAKILNVDHQRIKISDDPLPADLTPLCHKDYTHTAPVEQVLTIYGYSLKHGHTILPIMLDYRLLTELGHEYTEGETLVDYLDRTGEFYDYFIVYNYAEADKKETETYTMYLGNSSNPVTASKTIEGVTLEEFERMHIHKIAIVGHEHYEWRMVADPEGGYLSDHTTGAVTEHYVGVGNGALDPVMIIIIRLRVNPACAGENEVLALAMLIMAYMEQELKLGFMLGDTNLLEDSLRLTGQYPILTHVDYKVVRL